MTVSRLPPGRTTVSNGQVIYPRSIYPVILPPHQVHRQPVLASGPAALGLSRQEVIGTMPRELHALIPVSIPVPERRRGARLSRRAAAFWIVVLSLGGWTAIIALALALL
jgi:hypothetical protein